MRTTANNHPMKTSTLILLLMLLASSAFAQKKGKIDPKDVRIDSLTEVNAAITAKLDSVTRSLTLYHGVYDTVRTKVFKYAFEPDRTAVLIDSLAMSRDATLSGLSASAAVQKDTIAALRAENLKMQQAMGPEAQKTAAVAELKALKELLDMKAITQAEFDTRKATLVEKL